MAETLQKYPNPEAIVEDFSLIQDRTTGFFRTSEGAYIGFHRTYHGLDTELRPSKEGSMGTGVYVGNSEAVLTSFSKISLMQKLVVVELPCDNREVTVVSHPSGFNRQRFDDGNTWRDQPTRFLIWKPPAGNTLGCIAMGGLSSLPKMPRWGLWIDNKTTLKPFAQISNT